MPLTSRSLLPNLPTGAAVPVLAAMAAAARTWSVESQQVSRRNAMVAATECAQRRVERQEVAEYLSARTTGPAAPTGGAEATARAAHR